MPTHIYYVIIDFFDACNDGLFRYVSYEYYDLDKVKELAQAYASAIESGWLCLDGFDHPELAESAFVSVVRQIWGFSCPETESEVYNMQVSDLKNWKIAKSSGKQSAFLKKYGIIYMYDN